MVIVNMILIFVIYTIHKRYKSAAPQIIPSLDFAPSFALNDMKGKRYELDELFNGSSFVLLIFFSPLDCAPCLEEKYLWQRIAEEGRVKVVGVGRHVDARELRNWVSNSGLTFPVLYDYESRVTRNFAIKRTPFKILLDSTRKILLADPPRMSSLEQEEFIFRLNRAIGD